MSRFLDWLLPPITAAAATPVAADRKWADIPSTLSDIRLTAKEIEEFRRSRVWAHILQAGLEKRHGMLISARDPDLSERQSALLLGYSEGLEWLMDLPKWLGSKADRNPTEKSAADEQALLAILKLRGDIE